ncbi:MAG TPA: aspartate--tRNA(Asn) ligase [Chloroflexi bacterium]|jgi:nondiscriminating aspartyl-tRNA synthetase|nr:aspartate--tRNA(Asn) ligase [Chloroflexota bacterium]
MALTRTKDRVLAADLPAHKNERVLVEGWVHAIRKFGAVNFLILRDRSGMAQVILEPDQMQRLEGMQAETVVRVTGTVDEEERAAHGVEVRNADVEVLTPVTDVLPFEINKRVLKPSLDVFLNHAPVGLRYPSKQATFRLYSDLLRGFGEYLRARDFTEIHTPKIFGSATESGANVFVLDYFGKTGYLTQSPQLYKQIMVGVFERVYEIGPAFRAEEHYTARHLNEFNSLDAEMGFIDGVDQVLDLLIGVLEHMVTAMAERRPADLEALKVRLPVFGDVPRISFREAQQIILDEHGESRFHEPDFSPQDERWVSQWALREHGTDFCFVTHFPTVKRAFYTMPDPEDPEHSFGFDLLFRGQELVSGAQRIHNHAQLVETMQNRGMSLEPFEGYLEAFKFGLPPHGGFAIGSERLLMRLLEADNIRETTLFPRDVNRLIP